MWEVRLYWGERAMGSTATYRWRWRAVLRARSEARSDRKLDQLADCEWRVVKV